MHLSQYLIKLLLIGTHKYKTEIHAANIFITIIMCVYQCHNIDVVQVNFRHRKNAKTFNLKK